MMTEAEIEALKEKISSLRTEHHDLDAAIARMEESRIFEDDQLHRLKKKKLYLKDQIVTLERRLASETDRVLEGDATFRGASPSY